MVHPRMDDCKGKLAGMVAVIFLTGMASGALTMSLVERYWLRPRALELERQVALEHFRGELELNEQQARAVEAIVDELLMQQADLMEQFRNRRISGQDRLFQVLNEEQRKRLKKVLDEMNTQRQD